MSSRSSVPIGSLSLAPTKESLRQALLVLFKTPTDLNAFVIDHFPTILPRLPEAASLVVLINALFVHEGHERVWLQITIDPALSNARLNQRFQEQLRYDAQEVEAEVDRLKKCLLEAQTQVTSREAELSTAQRKLSTTGASLAALQSNFDELQARLEEMRTLALIEAKRAEPIFHVLEHVLKHREAEVEQKAAKLEAQERTLNTLDIQKEAVATREKACDAREAQLDQSQRELAQSSDVQTQKNKELLEKSSSLESWRSQLTEREVQVQEERKKVNEVTRQNEHLQRDAQLTLRAAELAQCDAVRKQRSWATVLIGITAGILLTRPPSAPTPSIPASTAIHAPSPLATPQEPVADRLMQGARLSSVTPVHQDTFVRQGKRRQTPSGEEQSLHAHRPTALRGGKRTDTSSQRASSTPMSRPTEASNRRSENSPCATVDADKATGYGASPGRSYAAP